MFRWARAGGGARPDVQRGPPALRHAGRLGGAGPAAGMYSGTGAGGGARPDVQRGLLSMRGYCYVFRIFLT